MAFAGRLRKPWHAPRGEASVTVGEGDIVDTGKPLVYAEDGGVEAGEWRPGVIRATETTVAQFPTTGNEIGDGAILTQLDGSNKPGLYRWAIGDVWLLSLEVPTFILIDDDAFTANSPVHGASQQSIKAYVDANSGSGSGRGAPPAVTLDQDITLANVGYDAMFNVSVESADHTLSFANMPDGAVWIINLFVGIGNDPGTYNVILDGDIIGSDTLAFNSLDADTDLEHVELVCKKRNGVIFATQASWGKPSPLIAAGVIAHGGNLPASILAGDIIYSVGVSAHNETGSKAMTIPAGFAAVGGALSPHVAGTFAPDHHWVKKTAVAADAGAAITFGGNTGASLIYFVVRGTTTETLGTGGDTYTSTVDLPSVADGGLHLVAFSVSGSPTTDPASPNTPTNYTKEGDLTPGFGTAAAFTRAGAPDPTGTVTFTSTDDASLTVTSIVVS